VVADLIVRLHNHVVHRVITTIINISLIYKITQPFRFGAGFFVI